MNSFLISIGTFSEQALPTVCSALSCGAARPVEFLDIFHIASVSVDPALPSLIITLNGFPNTAIFISFASVVYSLPNILI